MTMVVVSRGHELRPRVEHFISQIYSESHQAHIPQFPSTLLAMCNSDGAIQCASGLRYADDGFFSECYLDDSIEVALRRFTSEHLSRDDVFEVTSLASRAPHTASQFLRRLVAYGELAGFSWAFFTATERLRRLLAAIELPMLNLGAASRLRVANPESWGLYYDANPCVCAVNRASAAAFLRQLGTGERIHA